ncbi:MAG: alpha/beta hydrolase [Patescibacteria group bacterium]|nr:alpha/beta hydrolase [Patescibacteria group bacterium]
MKNALLLHGTNASPHSAWFPWLKGELEAHSWNTWVPELPGADAPHAKRYTEFLLSQGWDFNKESVIIGHSSGAVEIFHLLQALPEGAKIRAAVLIGAFPYDLAKHKFKVVFRLPFTWERLKFQYRVWRYEMRTGKMDVSGMFEEPLDFEKIRSRAEKFIFVHSDDDPFCPLSGAKYLANKLDGELKLFRGQKHFSVGTAGEKYRQFPVLLDIIENL